MVDRVLVYGAPGSGKSTYARGLADQGYTHLEREMFSSHAAFRYGVAWAKQDLLVVVRCCFSFEELEEWQELVAATRTFLPVADASECKRRVFRRHNRRWRGEILGVERWFSAMGSGHRVVSRAW